MPPSAICPKCNNSGYVYTFFFGEIKCNFCSGRAYFDRYEKRKDEKTIIEINLNLEVVKK